MVGHTSNSACLLLFVFAEKFRPSDCWGRSPHLSLDMDSRLSWFNTVDQKSQGTFGNTKKEKKVKSCFHSSYNPNEVNEREKKKACNFTSAFVISVNFFYP